MASGSNKVEIEVSANVTGEQSVGALGTALHSTGAAANTLGTKAAGAVGGVAAADNAAKGFTATAGNLRDKIESVSVQMADAKNQLLAFAGVTGFASSVKDVAALADAWKNMQSRLQLALGAQANINQAMQDVEGVAKRTYSSLDATANLYGKIASIGKEMGVSQADALKLTETINQSIQLSGASAQASEAAITQLIQGLQSGTIRGDEFNSIMEQAPRLSKAMADGLGVPVGALRGLAEQGKLTSQTVITALQGQSQAIGKEFTSLPLTVGRAVQNLQTEWQKFVGTLDANTGASSAAAAGIESIGKHLDDLARIAGVAGAALTATFAIQAAQALRTAAAEMSLTGGAALILRRNLDTLSKPVQIAIAVTGFEAGYQLGTWLHESSVSARKLGVVITEMGATIVNDLQFIEEATAALFTKDTIGKAVDRYIERSNRIAGITTDMFADAERAPEKVGAATDAASEKLGAMGSAAQAAGNTVASAGAQGAGGVAGIGKAADTARGALEKLAAAINAPKPADNGITAITKDLIDAKNRAQDFDGIIRTQLPDAIGKLSGTELVKFRSEFISAMDAAKQALQSAITTDKPRAEIDALRAKVDSFEKSTRTGLGLIAEQAAKSLGVDVPLAFNKMGAEFLSAQNNMAVLIRQLPELKTAGVDTATVVASALGNMIDGTKNKAELDAVTERIKTLRKELGEKAADGLLDQAKQKAEQLKDALDKAKPGINSLSEAMKELGVVSDKTLKETAEKSKQAFDAMKADGTASTRELADGFKAYAEKAIAANKGVASETLKAEAAVRGVTIAVDENGKATVANAEKSKKAIEEVTRAYIPWGEAAEKAAAREVAAREKVIEARERENRLAERAIELENKRRGVDKDGFSTDKSGQKIVGGSTLKSATGIMNFLKEAGIDDAAEVKRITEKFLDPDGTVTYANNRGQLEYGGDTVSMSLLHAAEQYTLHGGKERVARENEEQKKYLASLPGGTKVADKSTAPTATPASRAQEKLQRELQAAEEARAQDDYAKTSDGAALIAAIATIKNTPATPAPAAPAKDINVRLTLPDGTVKTVPTTQDGSYALIAALQSAKLSAGSFGNF